MVMLVLVLLMLPVVATAQTEFEGEVSGEWDTDGSPYIQIGNAQVPADDSLTILPGVEVILGEDMTLTCSGHISAQGTEEDTIRIHGPEGLVNGSLIFDTGEDTVRFQYCRFDSLEDAIWMLDDTYLLVQNCFFWENHYAIESHPIWAEVSNCTFIALRQDGKVWLGRNRRGGYYDGATVIFTDNWLQGRTEARFQCQSALVEHNEGVRLIVDDDECNPSLYFWESISLVCRENRNLRIYTNNLNRGLVEATVINNNSDHTIGFSNSGNARIVCDYNVCSSFGFIGARNATATGNIARGIGVHDGSQVILTRNFGPLTFTGNDNVVEVSNSTMVKEYRPIDPPAGVIHLVDDGNPHHGNRVILRNSILFGRQNCAFAVNEGIAVEGDGYNCIWGVPAIYAERQDPLPNDITVDPLFRGGYNFDCRLRADSPCIDAGDPDSPEDPDYTRADIGCYYFDQEHGEPPALNRRWDYYIGWHETFRYAAEAVDEGDALDIRFEDLPEWLEIEEDDGRRDFVRDSVVVSGDVPEDQEDFVFRVIATDDQDREDTLSVRVTVYPYRVLTGVVRGVLDIEQSPFIVADTVWVPAGDSLVLPPGTELFFDNREDSLAERAKSMLMVMGAIKAEGTIADSIWIGALDTSLANTCIQFKENPEALSDFHYCIFAKLRFDYTPAESNIEFHNNRLIDSDLQARGFTKWATVSQNHGTGTINLNGKGIVEDNSLSYFSVWHGDSVNIRQNSLSGMSIYYGSVDQVDTTTIIVEDNLLNGAIIADVFRTGGEYSAFYRKNQILGVNNAVAIKLSGQAHIEFTNNIIANCDSIAFKIYPFDHSTLVLNNSITNVETVCYARYSLYYEERFRPNLAILNNVFCLFDTLLYSHRGWTSGIAFNSISNFEWLSKDTTYITDIVQVNANGDSCDVHFNIYLDPRLANPDSLDFRLYNDSPLIDAGNPDSAFYDVDSTINDIGLYGGPYGIAYEYLDPNEVLSFDAPPRDFRVGNAYPNPFNATSHISIDIPYTGKTTFSLFDIQGRRVAHHSLQLAAGIHRQNLCTFLNMDLSGLRSGLYVLTIEFGGNSINRKLVLVK